MLKQGKMQQMKRNQRNALTRRELADVRHAVSKRNCTWLHFEKCTWRMRCVLVSLFFFVVTIVSPADDLSLWKIQKLLASKKYVDLTHGFAPGIPRWPGFPDETRKTIYWYDKRPDTMGVGFFSELFTHVGQWGTHVDPPAHFIKGLRTVDRIDPKEMVLAQLSWPLSQNQRTARVFQPASLQLSHELTHASGKGNRISYGFA